MSKSIALAPDLAALLDGYVKIWNARTRATRAAESTHTTCRTMWAEDLQRYVRVWTRYETDGDRGSAFAFVDKETGELLKPDGWKKPAKGSRGNLRDCSWLLMTGPYGVGYLPKSGHVSSTWPAIAPADYLVIRDALLAGQVDHAVSLVVANDRAYYERRAAEAKRQSEIAEVA
jgi:hypothetical protein